MKEILTIISKLERPFSVASADSYAHIENLKSFEPFAKTIISELRQAVPKNILADKLEQLFSGYDSLPTAEKIERIKSAKKTIMRFSQTPPEKKGKTTGQIKTDVTDVRQSPSQVDVKYVKGVGEQIAKRLANINIESVYDLLLHLPLRYEDRSSLKKISAITPGQEETFIGTVIDAGPVGQSFAGRGRRGRGIYQVAFKDETGVVIGKWFNYRKEYMDRKFKAGETFFVHGPVKLSGYNRTFEIVHPEIEDYEVGDTGKVHVGGITPIYGLTEGIQQRRMRTIVRGAVDSFIDWIDEYHSPELITRLELAEIKEALKKIHSPPVGSNLTDLAAWKTAYHRRLIFDEFFFLELGLALRREGIKEEKRGKIYKLGGSLTKRFLSLLPFTLTEEQKKVMGEIEKDLTSDTPMNRLLQGDVGCGKTVVAFHTLLIAIENGFQAAIMAPTEILAEQHYKNFKSWGETLGLKIALLKSGLKGKEKKENIEAIKNGEVDIAIGTHAVIQEGVEFKHLGLAVIDEQHRFGVMQRGTLKKKGINSDILIMTATPIPRTLAMTVYGDLDVSIINEMPKGRKPIKTSLLFDKGLPKAYSIIEKEVAKGGQAYIIYPLVEESEKSDLKAAITMKEHLEKDIFPNFKVGLVHGKMKSAEKDGVMLAFRNGEIDILVATTVVEVGVDVPNASVMMIEHAERFGLSQLHQLRGRIGRGERESQCILMAHYPISNEGKQRLRVMTESQDGFYIAEKDLEIRGPGQFLGTRQAGLPQFKVANIIRDQQLLQTARKEAFRIVAEDPHLKTTKYISLKEILKKGYRKKFELGEIG
ncbi:MAG: ATP-dependent DNA helicase RecG [Nitrospinota bacterium]